MKLLEQLDQKLRIKGSPISTRKTYGQWVRRYFLFILKVNGPTVHPKDLGSRDVEKWLTHLAVNEHVAPSTQDNALQSVLFLYRQVMGIELTGIDALRSRRPKRMPTVLSIPELGKIFPFLARQALLIAQLQTGCGLRIGEAVSLRMKDLDFDREQIIVRHAKGAKDRATVFPKELHESVKHQMQSMEVLFDSDRRGNMPGVSMPHAFGRKSKNASSEWPWFYLFASGNLSRHPDTRELGRHHIDGSNINRQFKTAAANGKVAKRVTSHTFRHSFATHMLCVGTDIMTLASMMGHDDIRTTQVYLHCNINSGEMQRSPFARLLAGEFSTREGERQREAG